MDRREAIKSYIVISAGVLLLPSCLQDNSKLPVALNNIKIRRDQYFLLADLSETLIPETTTPGAKTLSSHLFVLTMVDDCMAPMLQQKFLTGMEQFNIFCKKKAGRTFSDCSLIQKKELLTAFEMRGGISEEALFFYATAKKFTIESFVTSQYFLTKVNLYEQVPGRFHGCLPLKKKDSIS